MWRNHPPFGVKRRTSMFVVTIRTSMSSGSRSAAAGTSPGVSRRVWIRPAAGPSRLAMRTRTWIPARPASDCRAFVDCSESSQSCRKAVTS